MIARRPSWKSGFARPGQGLPAHPGLWKGLRHLWVPSLGATGSTLYDLGGLGNHGALNAAFDLTTDWVRDGLRFTDANDTFAELDPYNYGTVHTFVWTVRWVGLRTGILLCRGSAGFPHIRHQATNNIEYRPNAYVDLGHAANTVGETDTFAITRSGTAVDLYWNGALADSKTLSSDDAFDLTTMRLGGRAGIQFDDVLLSFLGYDRVLTTSEIRQHALDPLAIVLPKSRVRGGTIGREYPTTYRGYPDASAGTTWQVAPT